MSKSGRSSGALQRGFAKAGSPRGGHKTLRRDKVTTIKQAMKAARRKQEKKP